MQVDKTWDNAHKKECWSNIFSAISKSLYPLKGEADVPREGYLTPLYIDIKHCDNS